MQRARILTFVAVVNLFGLAGMFALRSYHVADYWMGLALLAMLASLGGAGMVRIPSHNTSVSTTDGFVFAALAAFGPVPACLVAASGVLGAIFGKEAHRKPIHVAFNVGNVITSTWVASMVYLLAGGVSGGSISRQVYPLFLAAFAYLLPNTLLVAVAVFVSNRGPFVKTWRESARWAAVSASLGLTVSVALLWAIEIVGPSGLALGVPPCWMLASFYRTHKMRQEESQQRIDQVEEANVHLEEKVADRMSSRR